MSEFTFEYEDKIVVVFNTTRFLDGGDSADRLGRNLPINLDRLTGSCEFCALDEVMLYVDLGLFPER
ncbi:hypothetical protein GCM10009682_26540 [Luedemannella flava]|uniref:Uncharacterized protein n=1 Tax=Luedemannella flava TaxID=349316 RepID=A0ABN2LYZ7_9ACTN